MLRIFFVHVPFHLMIINLFLLLLVRKKKIIAIVYLNFSSTGNDCTVGAQPFNTFTSNGCSHLSNLTYLQCMKIFFMYETLAIVEIAWSKNQNCLFCLCILKGLWAKIASAIIVNGPECQCI